MSKEDSTSEVRLRAFLDGDEDALRSLCLKYEKPLRKVIKAYLDPNVRRRVDESDLLQMTWMHAIKQLQRTKKIPENGLFPLMRQIARERVVDAHRAHRNAEIRNVYNEQALDIPDASVNNLVDRLAMLNTSPSKLMERHERKRIVHQALKALKPEFHEIIVLRFLEQLNIKECAEAIGLTLDGAKSRRRRALQAFTKEITKDLNC